MWFTELHTITHLLAAVPICLASSGVLRAFIVLYIVIDSCLQKYNICLLLAILGLFLAIVREVWFNSESIGKRNFGMLLLLALIIPETFRPLGLKAGETETKWLHIVHHIAIWSSLTLLLLINYKTMVACHPKNKFR